MLDRVGIPQPNSRVDDYPHQFSGGMRQRAMIAMALSCNPDLLIADEPTTALDVTVQAQILDLIRDLQQEFNSAVIIITHDLGVVAELADDILVMYAGRSVEYGERRTDLPRTAAPVHVGAAPVDAAARPGAIGTAASDHGLTAEPDQRAARLPVPPALRLRRPQRRGKSNPAARVPGHRRRPFHRLPPERRGPSADLGDRNRADPVTAEPTQLPAASPAAGDDALLTVTGLQKYFPVRRGILQRQVGAVQAVDGLDFTVNRGETLSLVGESGCGKTTTGRLLTRLLEPTGGQIVFDGRDITHLSAGKMRPLRRDVQMIFQDPYSSLNPRHTVGTIVGAPFHLQNVKTEHGTKRAVQELLELVGLNPEHYNRYPHEFSGGQRQRIGIARSLALRPKLIVADEPVSALDVSIQAQVINLLEDLQDELGLTYVVIAHDLSVVRHMSDRVAVMYLGKLVEIAGRRRALRTADASVHRRADVRGPGARPRAPHRARPDPAAGRPAEPAESAGRMPLPHALPLACEPTLRREVPLLRPVGEDHFVACRYAEQVASGAIQPSAGQCE